VLLILKAQSIKERRMGIGEGEEVALSFHASEKRIFTF
jgi:hypothetical protein